MPGSAYGFLLGRHHLQIGSTEFDNAAFVIANFLIGGTPASRLAERLRQDEGLSYSVASFFGPDAIDGGAVFGIYASFGNDRLEPLRAALEAAIADIRRTGFQEREVRQAAQSIARERRASLANELMVAATLAGLAANPSTLKSAVRDEARLQAIGAAEVNEAARQLLDSQRLRLIFAGNFDPPR